MAENSKSTKPPPAKVEWYYERDGAVFGPITEARLRYSVKYGHIKPDTLIWRNDSDHWLEARSVPVAAAVLNRAPSSPGIEPTSIRLRVEPSKDEPQEITESIEATETQQHASSPEEETYVAEVLHDAITEEEAAEPIIDVNLARAIVERTSGRPTEPSIPPASFTFRPPPGASSSLIAFAAGRSRLIALSAASILIAAAALIFALWSRTGVEQRSNIPKTAPNRHPEPSAAPPASAVSAAPHTKSEPAIPNWVGPGSEGATPATPSATEASAAPVVTVSGPLDPALFLQHLKRALPIFDEQCWDVYRVPGVKAEPRPSVSIELDVDRTGRVYDARSGKAPKAYRGVGRCIAGRARGWKFPPAEEGTHAVVTVKRTHD